MWSTYAMADKTIQDVVDSLALQDSDLVLIKVRTKRRPRYIRAGLVFPFGTSTHAVTLAQLDVLQADTSGALAITRVDAPAPGASDEETPPLSLDGVDDGLTDDVVAGQDGPTADQEVVLGQEKLARIIAVLSNRPEDSPVVMNGEGKPDMAWLKKTLGEKVTAAERDAALSVMDKAQE